MVPVKTLFQLPPYFTRARRFIFLLEKLSPQIYTRNIQECNMLLKVLSAIFNGDEVTSKMTFSIRWPIKQNIYGTITLPYLPVCHFYNSCVPTQNKYSHILYSECYYKSWTHPNSPLRYNMLNFPSFRTAGNACFTTSPELCFPQIFKIASFAYSERPKMFVLVNQRGLEKLGKTFWFIMTRRLHLRFVMIAETSS